MTESKIAFYRNAPTLFINGRPHTSMAYMTYLRERGRFRQMYELGCRLFSAATFFAASPLNTADQIHPLEPGIYETPGAPDFAPLDDLLAQIVGDCPEGWIFLRVNTNLPRWWEQAHPDALCETGIEGAAPRACPADPGYRETCADFLRQYIEHVENSPYADRVIGYQIAGGQTEEWQAIDGNGNRGKAMDDAFAAEHPELVRGTEEAEEEFRRFTSEKTAETVCLLAKAAKECVKGRKIIGAFYGYTFETPWWQNCHSALDRILRCPEIEFMASPLSYLRVRGPGIDWAPMMAADSLRLHGKLYFAEADVRTYLSGRLADARENVCEPGSYEQPLWFGPKDPWLCRQEMRAVVMRMLTHNTSLWWFDMWGGWYDGPELIEELRTLYRLADMENGSREQAELAVYVDEKATAKLTGDRYAAVPLLSEGRIPLGHCGAPYDVYLTSDFAETQEKYKAAVFFVAAETDEMSRAIRQWRESGRPELTATLTGPRLAAESVAELCDRGGVHRWCAPGDVIYASSRWASLYAAEAGEKTIRLPGIFDAEDLTDGRKYHSVTEITVTVRQYETRILRLTAADADR